MSNRFENLQREFPDFDVANLPAIPAEWQDSARHNDICPSFQPFQMQGRTMQVFVDYADTAEREFPESPRFVVVSTVKDTCDTETHYCGDDWETVLECVTGLEKAALGAEYFALVGYNPFEDEPTISVAEVRQTIAEYKETAAKEGRDNV